MALRILDQTVIDALVRARIIDNPNVVRRVVIDIKAGEPVKVYIDRFAEDNHDLIGVIESVGIEIQMQATDEGGQ
jgi:hypothetical protein